MSAKTVQLMAFDVDGVFTDGTLYYGIEGDALKAFNILDGLGLKLLQKAGIKTAIITGRQSPMVERRFQNWESISLSRVAKTKDMHFNNSPTNSRSSIKKWGIWETTSLT